MNAQRLISYDVIWKQCRSWIFPPYCSFCKMYLPEYLPLCSSCIKYIIPIASCSLSLTATKEMTVHALGAYNDPLCSLIRAKNNKNILSAHKLAELIDMHGILDRIQFQSIIPVPLHWKRYAARGYNQAEEIAKIISNLTKKPVLNVLTRIRYTQFQADCNAHARHENVHAAFQLTNLSSLVRDSHILIIDDLMTTGATLREIGRTLLSAKPTAITALVAARVV